MKVKGKAFVFGDNLNTDEIIPARYLNSSDPGELAKSLMEDARPGFGQREDIAGSIIVGGENFGCGSSREHAPLAIKAAGIVCVISKSFSRLFLRNSINIGLPSLELESAAEFREDDQLEVDFQAGKVVNLTQGKEYSFIAYPVFLQQIFGMGGWLEYVKGEKKAKALSEYLHEIAQFPYKSENIKY